MASICDAMPSTQIYKIGIGWPSRRFTLLKKDSLFVYREYTFGYSGSPRATEMPCAPSKELRWLFRRYDFFMTSFAMPFYLQCCRFV